MHMKLYIILNLIFPTIYGIEARWSFRKTKWIDDLVECILKNFDQHQTVIIDGEKDFEESEIINEIIRHISRQIPTKSFTYEEILGLERSRGLSSISSIMNPDAATLYMPILMSNDVSQLKEVMNASRRLSYPKPRPKYLMLHLNGTENISHCPFLEDLWRERFLHATVVQFTRSSLESTDNYFLDQQEEDVTVHMYNPSNQSYSIQTLTSESILFPDKERNLYSSKFKSALNPRFPGQKALGETLARSMKSTPVYTVGQSGKDTEFFLTEERLGNWETNASRIYSYAKFTDMETIHAVVPKNRVLTIEIPWEFFLTILATILGIFLIRFLAKVLKFEDRPWRLWNVIQMILGVSVTDEPRLLAERIVFVINLLTWIIYSGYIHSGLTNLELHQESGTINNLDDVIKLGFVTMLTPHLKEVAESGMDYISTKLSNQSTPVPYRNYIEVCTEHLLRFKNVICLLYNSQLEYVIQHSSEIEVIREPIAHSWLVFRMRGASPYRDRINQVLSRLRESGLLGRMMQRNKQEPNFEQYDPEESQQLIELWKILVGVLLVGFLFSIIAFFAEVIIGWFKKKIESHLNVRRNRRA